MSVLVAGSALEAATTVSFEAAVGGSNNGAGCDKASRAYFTGGSTTDGAVVPLDANGDLTWSVLVSATGNDGTGEIRGVANMVFDVELYSGSTVDPGNLVSTATFHSTTNSGTCEYAGEDPADPTVVSASNAAFAYSFNVSNKGPGRVFDRRGVLGATYVSGGPRMDVHSYPTDAGDGRLLGMGAGYSNWMRGNGNSDTVAGVGQVDGVDLGDPSYGPQGRGPVAEGQIAGLSEGTYTLRVVAGGGINVLRADVDLSNTISGSFARAADVVTPDDTITFDAVSVSPCTITGWASVRSHDNHGELPIEIDATADNGTGGVTIDPRRYGIQKIVVSFDSSISIFSGTVEAINTANGTAIAASAAGPDPLDDTKLVIEFDPGLSDGCYRIDIGSNLADCITGDTDAYFVSLEGDSSGDTLTNVNDFTLLRSLNGTLLDPSTARYDISCDGLINVNDATLARALNGGYATCGGN
jgi:hypothetical protein